MPKNQAAPITQDAAIQEMNRLLFEAPIAELAESQGIYAPFTLRGAMKKEDAIAKSKHAKKKARKG